MDKPNIRYFKRIKGQANLNNLQKVEIEEFHCIEVDLGNKKILLVIDKDNNYKIEE